MKNIILMCISFVFIGSILTTFTGCKREGCTDPDATNYDSKAKENDGSCQYEGKLGFWWDQSYHQNSIYEGLISVKIYIDNEFIISLPVSTQFAASAPNCGASATVTVIKTWANAKTKQLSIKEKYCWDDNTETDGNTYNVTIEGNTCKQYKLAW